MNSEMAKRLDSIAALANDQPLEASLLLVDYFANLSGINRADQMAENAWVMQQGKNVWRKTLRRFRKALEQERENRAARDKRASVIPQA